jgi:uncharacterized membrane protein YfcA
MWEQYRRRFFVTQAFILSIGLILKLYVKADWANILAAVLVMELGSVVGAAWGTRLSRKIEAKRDELPLDRR